MSKYIFERVSTDNISDLNLLFNKNGKKFSDSYFHLKFASDYTGSKFLGYFAYAYSEKKKEVAAFYAVYPIHLKINQQIILAAQSGDTITDINHRKKGLFTQLATRTLSLAEEEGVQLIFAFPNQNSAPGFYNKLDFIKGPTFNKIELKENRISLYNISNKLKVPFVYRFYLKFILKKYHCAVSEFSPILSNIPFNNDYYAYKKYENSFLIKIDQFNFWLKLEDGIILGDVGKFDLNDSTKFISVLHKLMKIISVKKLHFEFQEFHPIQSLFKENNINIMPSEVELAYLPINGFNIKMNDLLISISNADTF